MAKPIGPAWRSLSWKVEPGHALAEGRDDRVVVRLMRPKVGGASLVLLFEARPEVACVTVSFEAEDAFGSNASAALRAPIASLVEDAAAHAEDFFASKSAAVADAGLDEAVERVVEADRLATSGVVDADFVAGAFLELYRSASIAASTRNRPVAWMAERLRVDRATVHRWVARGRELVGEEDENAGGSRLARIQQLEREMEGESDARKP